MKRLLPLVILVFMTLHTNAQVGINNVSPNASLDIQATNQALPSNNDGFLVPRIDAFPASDPGAAQNSMIVYLTTTDGGNPPGFYFWNQGTLSWDSLTGSGADQIDDLTDGVNDGSSIFLGNSSGANDDGGNSNTGLGDTSLNANTSGVENTAIGFNTLSSNTAGSGNIAMGLNALSASTFPSQNIAIGYNAMTAAMSNPAASFNIGIGSEVLNGITSGRRNVAVGATSGQNISSGIGNVGLGYGALQLSTNADYNVAVGYDAGRENSSGDYNAYVGYQSGENNTSGDENTLVGANAGFLNVAGSGNVFLGNDAGYQETGSDKLYIDNSNTTLPLVYGDFQSNDFRINGDLQVGDPSTTGYEFPAADGTANQVLRTDGSGVLGWVSVSPGADDIDDLNDGINDGSSVFLGTDSGSNDDGTNASVGVGRNALNANTSGVENTAIGFTALLNNTTGIYNTAVGSGALRGNTLGTENVAVGRLAMSGSINNAFVRYNVAIGNLSLSTMTTGSSNTAVGYAALLDLDGGGDNVAVGTLALQNVTTGSGNTGVGNQAGEAITSGRDNTVVGNEAGEDITDGFENTILGHNAGSSITSGGRNTIIGDRAGSSLNLGSANVFIGANAGGNVTNSSNQLYIDNTATTTPLIYGDFATDELRVNGELQVGNPATTGFQFPLIDGSANQVLQTNGSGTLSWENSSSEWTDGGSYMTTADGIAENILIGTTTPVNYKMRLVSTGSGGTTIDMANTGLTDGMVLTSTNSTGDGLDISMTSSYNLSNRSALEANLTYGAVQTDVARYESGGTTYGFKTTITSTLIGNEYGIYSNVLTPNGFAGYFLGDVAIGTTTGNTYTLPASRGTNGQVMTTDGLGNVSWSTISTGDSTTASNGLTESGDDVQLGGSLTQNTTITNGTHNLIHNLSSTGYFEVQDAGTAKFRISNTGNTRVGGDLQVNQNSVTGTRLLNLTSSGTTGLIDVYAGGVQTARIAGTGDSYINGGPFGVGINNPQEVLDVVGNTSTAFIGDFYNESTSSLADGISIRLAATNPNASAYYVGFYRNSGGTVSGRISGTGAGVDYLTTSDARLKTNFRDVEGALQMIASIDPQWYEFKDNLGQEEMGFLAQELKTIYPQAVSGDANSNPITDPMMVDYGRITPLLTAGIQELEKKVNALEAENAALKESLKKYEDLEARIAALEDSTSSGTDTTIVAEKDE